MQFISDLYTNQHTLPILAGIALLFFHIAYHKCVSTSNILSFIMIWNILTISQCIKNPVNVICIVYLQIYIHLSQKQSQKYKVLQKIIKIVILIGFIVGFPQYSPFIILYTLIQKQKTSNKNILNNVVYGIILCGLSGLSIYFYHYDKFFPTQFSSHSGISWILYSHMFHRYLLLYQTIPLICTYISIFPLSFCKAPQNSKLTAQWFICIYFMYNTTLIHIWMLFILQINIYSEIINKISKRKQIIWNVLTIIAFLVSIMSYLFYQRLMWLWKSTHLVSMGYILLQILLFWGTHAVYISQSLIILDEEKEEQKRVKLIIRIKNYLKDRFQQM